MGNSFCSLLLRFATTNYAGKPQGNFQLILHATTFPMHFELSLSLSLLIVERLASSSGKLFQKVFHVLHTKLSPHCSTATVQLAPLIYVYFKLISRCSDLIKLGAKEGQLLLRAAKTHLLWQQAAANLLNRKTTTPTRGRGRRSPRKRTEQRSRGRGRGRGRGSQCKENPITKMNLCTFQRESKQTTQEGDRGGGQGGGARGQ